MALITDVVLSIERDSHAAGSVCTIAYSYRMICDQAEVDLGIGFSMWCEIWGRDLLVDDMLGQFVYDSHTLKAQPEQRISRTFQVPCKVLDEDWGEDEIYLMVHGTSTTGTVISGQSEVIRDRF